MAKGAEAFRSIGEVAKLIGVAPHVLRYWETQFSLLKPMKRGDGRRYYRPDDVRLAAGLCEVLRDEGLTIRGAKKLLAKDRGESVRVRGALKLGEAAEAEAVAATTPAMPAATTPATTPAMPAPKPMATPAPAATASHAPPLPDAASLAEQDQPEHAPRSRNRKRPAARSPEPLPLFPEDAPADAAIRVMPVDAAQAGWLGELVQLSGLLRSRPGGAELSQPARSHAHRLLDAIADHY